MTFFYRVMRPGRLYLMRFPIAASTRGTSRIAPSYARVANLSTGSFSREDDKKNSILELFQHVADGKVSPQAAVEHWRSVSAAYRSVEDFAKIDTTRKARTGFPEVVYAEGKTAEQVAAIMKVMMDKSDDIVMASRVTAQAAERLRALIPDEDLTYYEVPRILASASRSKGVGTSDTDTDEKKPTVCVLCAGTSDLPVAEEAAVTLELAHYGVTRLYDVGVAGIHRLLHNQHIVQASDVAICVAGMDGALPGVVGGITSVPVIAVPTSVGYGAAFGGLAPLLTMLNACSPGVGVVNIDNGFGAAVLAARILQQLR